MPLLFYYSYPAYVNIITERLLKKFQNSSSLFVFSFRKYECDHERISAFLVSENVLQMGVVCRTQIYFVTNWVLAQAGVPGWGLPVRYSSRWPASLSKSEAGNLKKRVRLLYGLKLFNDLPDVIKCEQGNIYKISRKEYCFIINKYPICILLSG